MSDNHFHIDALRNYLSGQEWRDTIRVFIASNCPFFSNIDDLHPEQAVIWRSFQDVAETVIHNMLTDIGGNMEDLEVAFDEILRAPSRGPRDEAIKDVLKQLESVDDFSSFAEGMHQACVELFEETGRSIHNNMHDAIMRMGFTIDKVNSTIKAIGEEGTLEEALMMLTSASDDGYGQGYDAKGEQGVQSPRYRPDAKESAYSSTKPSQPRYQTAVEKFVAEAAAKNIDLELSEVNALFVIAESVLEAQREAIVNPDLQVDPSEATEKLVQWASDMRYLVQDLETAFHEQIPCDDMTFHDEKGLLHFYLSLEDRRQEINAHLDSSHAYYAMVSDAELKRMADLDAIAATGNENEQRLHRFLSRHEEVRKEIAQLYRKCAIFLHTHPEVKQDQVHQMYLLLKDQLTGNDQGGSSSSSSSNTPFDEDVFLAMTASPEQQQMVNILLDIHIREDEQAIIKREIHDLLGIEHEDPSAARYGDKASSSSSSAALDPSAVYFDEKGNPIYLDNGHGLGTEGDKQQHQPHGSGAGGDGSSGSNGADFTGGNDGFHAMMRQAQETTSASDAKEEAMASGGSAHEGDQHDRAAEMKHAESAANLSPMKRLAEHEASKQQQQPHHHGDAVVDALKNQHRQALQQLKQALDHDKQRKLHRLEARLALLRERQATPQEIRGVEEETKQVLDDADVFRDGVVAGFKQRCLTELRTVREALAAQPPGMVIDANDIDVHLLRLLNSAPETPSATSAAAAAGEVADAKGWSTDNGDHAAAAAAGSSSGRERGRSALETQSKNMLLKQYEAETLSLLQRMQHQRQRQQEALQQRLQQQQQRGGSTAGSGSEAAGGGVLPPLATDESLLAALRKNEETTMLAMATAMHLPPRDVLGLSSEAAGPAGRKGSSSLASSSMKTAAERKRDGIEDDDYLNDDEAVDDDANAKERRHRQMMQWMEQAQHIQRQYQQAGDHLRATVLHQLTSAAAASGQRVDEATQLQALADAEQVLLQAFAHHMDDAHASVASLSRAAAAATRADNNDGGIDDKRLQADVKAHLLEAFEAAKVQHQQVMRHGRDASHQRLRNRLNQQSHGSAAGAENQPPQEQSLQDALTHAIDAFVSDAPMPVASSSHGGGISFGGAAHHPHARDDDVLRQEKERIKQAHSKNEQELVDTLQAAMEQKKRHLEDRLRAKRQLTRASASSPDRTPKQIQVAATGIDPNQATAAGEDDDDTRRVQAQLVAWDAAFHRVKTMVETTQSQFSPAQMDDLLDRCFREMMNPPSSSSSSAGDAAAGDSKATTAAATTTNGVNLHTIGGSPTRLAPLSSSSLSPIKSPLPSRAEAKDETLSMSSTRASMSKPPLRQSMDQGPTVTATPPPSLHYAADALFGGSGSEQTSENNSRRNSILDTAPHTHGGREVLQSEAHRITSNFTQEQQRHDLMMKIQQARQRQTLQRKLWERNQQKQTQPSSTGGAAEEETDGLIGARKPWLQDAMAAKQASETVRGLVMPANLPMRADPKAMSMRGMNLGPLMRK